MGRPWTTWEERDVLREKRSGMTTRQIADNHGRSVVAIAHKLARLPATAADSPFVDGQLPPYRRPSWTRPDQALIAVCHEARAEIQKRLRRA